MNVGSSATTKRLTTSILIHLYAGEDPGSVKDGNGVKNVNPTKAFLVGTVIVLIALFLPGAIGGILLLLIAAFAAALLMGTWNRLTLVGRAARLVILALLVITAFQRIF